MPVEPTMQEATGPRQAHFALLMDDSGMRLAIPPGASLWLVEDRSQADKIFPLVLKKVSVKKIVFEMRQADGSACEYTYQLMTAKPLSKAAYAKVVKNKEGQKILHQK